MATNYVQPGSVLALTAPGGGVVSGTAYLFGTIVAVAMVDADAGETFSGKITGVFSYTKPGSQAWTVGAAVYWDDSAKKFTTTSGGNTLAGIAVEAVGSGSGETTGKVLINGLPDTDV
jgi:predicted RecA/RadA family phage recombinase